MPGEHKASYFHCAITALMTPDITKSAYAINDAISALSVFHSLCTIKLSKGASKGAPVADGILRQANDATGFTLTHLGTYFITYYSYPDIIFSHKVGCESGLPAFANGRDYKRQLLRMQVKLILVLNQSLDQFMKCISNVVKFDESKGYEEKTEVNHSKLIFRYYDILR